MPGSDFAELPAKKAEAVQPSIFPAYGIRQVSTLGLPDVCYEDNYLNSSAAYKFIVTVGLSTYFPHSSFLS